MEVEEVDHKPQPCPIDDIAQRAAKHKRKRHPVPALLLAADPPGDDQCDSRGRRNQQPALGVVGGLPQANLSPGLAELFITGPVGQADALTVRKSELNKCGRCWRHLPEVTEDGDLCDRCEGVVHGQA